MISRRSALALAELFHLKFTRWVRTSTTPGSRTGFHSPKNDELYDFLYENEYDTWLCNCAKMLRGERGVKEFIMQLHTGEATVKSTPQWTWDQRKKLGQRLLRELSQDIIKFCDSETRPHYDTDTPKKLNALRGSLELDGYIYRDGRLLQPEKDVLDVEAEVGVLDGLYSRLALGNKVTAFHHLKLSEEHYLGQRWGDAIGNARKFLEVVLQEVVRAHSTRVKGAPLPEDQLNRPVEVRNYLEREGLLERREKDTLSSVYGLLSHTGGHPYMAQNDQARLLRHFALTFSQFVMLRFEGASKSAPAGP